MKNTTPTMRSQEKASGPFAATLPIVSSPTMVQMRKKRMSMRPKCLRSFFFSSIAATVVRSIMSAGIEMATFETPHYDSYRVDHGRVSPARDVL